MRNSASSFRDSLLREARFPAPGVPQGPADGRGRTPAIIFRASRAPPRHALRSSASPSTICFVHASPLSSGCGVSPALMRSTLPTNIACGCPTRIDVGRPSRPSACLNVRCVSSITDLVARVVEERHAAVRRRSRRESPPCTGVPCLQRWSSTLSLPVCDRACARRGASFRRAIRCRHA